MANKSITFTKKINVSLQPTDLIYYLDTAGNKIQLGSCISVAEDRLSFVVNVLSTAKPPQDNAYFMFNKKCYKTIFFVSYKFKYITHVIFK